MRYRRFAAFNLAGALVWGTLMVVAGYLAGASWRSAQHLVSTVGLGLTAAVVVAVGVGFWVARRRARRHRPDQPVAGRPEAWHPGRGSALR
jgi:membrane protein DedA with SNARE-associated domain